MLHRGGDVLRVSRRDTLGFFDEAFQTELVTAFQALGTARYQRPSWRWGRFAGL
jgi:hypothetical protein